MSDPYVIFDHSRAPIHIARFTGAAPTDESFQAYLDGLSALYVDPRPLAIVFDAEAGFNIGFRHQKMQADWLQENDALLRTYCRGTAYVIKSVLVRTTLRAIFALQSQAAPYHITPDFDEGMRWCEEKLDQAQEAAG